MPSLRIGWLYYIICSMGKKLVSNYFQVILLDYTWPLKRNNNVFNACQIISNYFKLSCLTLSAGKTTGIPIHVFGTETHMTAIVGMALGHRPIPNQPPMDAHTANFLLNASSSAVVFSFSHTLRGYWDSLQVFCFYFKHISDVLLFETGTTFSCANCLLS